jgi:hypothetical protein
MERSGFAPSSRKFHARTRGHLLRMMQMGFAMKIILSMVLAASVAGCLTASEVAPMGSTSQRLGRQTVKYDGSWYKTNGWGGEYPDGFTMARDVTAKIRGSLDLDAPKSISCVLRKGATYHPWNKKRVVSDRLEFIAFTRIETYELSSSYTVELSRRSDGSDTTIQFKKGDRWLYLAGLAEGAFLIKFNDTVYEAGQDLYEKSNKVDTPVNGDESEYDEWLRLRCANGAIGWIFFNEIIDEPAFSKPNIARYGHASDL